VNSWFERLLAGLRPCPSVPLCSEEEARLVLELAGAAAHTSGSRPFAPLATYLAGQAAAAGDPQARIAVLRAAIAAAQEAGPAGNGGGTGDPVPTATEGTGD